MIFGDIIAENNIYSVLAEVDSLPFEDYQFDAIVYTPSSNFDTKSANNMYKYFQNDFDLFGYDKSDWETSLYLSQMRSFLASLPILGV